MTIQIDTREKPDKNLHIVEFFDEVGIRYYRSKNYVGDYVSLDNPRIVVERKKNVLEFAGNAGKKHATFKKELERLKAIGGNMTVLIEEDIGNLVELRFWHHRRSQMKGEVLYKICKKWQEEYDLKFIFCKPEDSGRIIAKVLENGNE